MTISGTLMSVLAIALSHGGGNDDRARVTGTCGGGVRSQLELRAEDGAIAVEFRVSRARRDSAWRLTLSQEGRVAWHGTARARGGDGAFRIRRSLRDLGGADRISVRAAGPGGVTCRATATLAGE